MTPRPSTPRIELAPAQTRRALSKAQRRHLVELLGDGKVTLYWHLTYGSPEHRSAVALRQRGLVKEEGSIIAREGGGFCLTDKGRALAEELSIEGPRD